MGVPSSLSEIFLGKEKGARIIHDPRVIWNTIDVVEKCGGEAIASKTGHAFMKAAMRNSDAIYGGEMSLITTLEISPIVIVGLFPGYWYGNISRRPMSHYQN